jgi:hypothetical protein
MSLHSSLVKTAKQVFESGFSRATGVVTNPKLAEKALGELIKPIMPEYEVHWVASPSLGEDLVSSIGYTLLKVLRPLSDYLLRFITEGFRDYLVATLSPIDRPQTDLEKDVLQYVKNSRYLKSLSIPEDTLKSLTFTSWQCFMQPITLQQDLCYWLGQFGYSHLDRPLSHIKDFEKSAFCVWILPGHVVICAKPKRVVYNKKGVSKFEFHEELEFRDSLRPNSLEVLLSD